MWAYDFSSSTKL